MKYLIIVFFFLINIESYSQQSDSIPNFVEKKMAHFYKDSWKPFSGSVLIVDEDLKLITKVKIENGFETIAEMYNKDNKLVQVFRNGIETEFDNLKTEFSKNETYIDSTKLKHNFILISYIKNYETNQTDKFNGVIQFDKTKMYYANGIKVKVEYYFDEDLNKLKETYEIFYTELGNIEFEEEIESYHGSFQIFNTYGQVIEQGKYNLGKKLSK